VGIERRVRMIPQHSYRMVSMHARTASYQILKESVCYAKRKHACDHPDIELNKGNWYAPLGGQSANWIKRHRPKIVGTMRNKPPGYWLLVPKYQDSSNSNTTIIHNLRNRSLLLKSRERSIRQGGRMGDTNIRR
jgi:hypothetical protein